MRAGLLLTPVRRCAVFGTTRTNQDKRNAATPMLKDDEWAKWSDDEIAKHCAVSQRLVIAVLTDEAKNCSKGTLGTSLFVPVRDTAPWNPSRNECWTRNHHDGRFAHRLYRFTRPCVGTTLNEPRTP